MQRKMIILVAVIVLAVGGTIAAVVLSDSGSDSTDGSSSQTSSDHGHEHDEDEHEHEEIGFIEGALANDIKQIDCTLSDGSSAKCQEITIAGQPADYNIGPFCPATTSTSADDAGIWLDGENMYDADGEFIKSLSQIYNDSNWKLYNDDGTVNITDTEEAFDAAARPNVDPAYQNHCVEGKLAWLDGGKAIEYTAAIPNSPAKAASSTPVNGKVGVTYGGVVIDPAAPVSAILGAYTIATFDDCGGHVNPVEGYHLHAATGCSEVGEEYEGETKAFAIAMDGYNIHSPYASGEEPSDLDACNGHTTDELGYHYHANQPEKNAVLSCFMGVTESSGNAGGGPGGPPR